ncbi:putative disease resistance protein RGA4 [Ziziphus jujuba]|uniref:Disease resistance protein RGA4 n=1 Tax=Ziziphus jujuba TaxID=326968 RepID=A0ABM4A2I7_ZIZJJ|nr:putative disease resistance protein RGA4 [Ziziphus jujuba]
MAEGAIISVVASIIRLLGTPTFKELGNFWGHKKKFEKLEKTMSLLEAVIHDAEAKQVDSHQIKHWLQRLEDAVYDVDNLLDEFQTEALRRQVMSGNETTTKVRTFFSNSNPIAFQVKMGLKLRKVRKTLKVIKDDSIFGTLIQQVHLEPHTEHANNRETHSFVRDEEVVGRDDDKKKIIDLLLCSDSRDKDNPSFLPIVGIGGLGKTTLAQFVYNDKNVEKYFHLRMWVCLFGSFELKIILEKMIKSTKKRASVEQGLDLDQLHGSVEQGPDVDQLLVSVRQGLDLDQLQNSLRQAINGKRYLLVLDDVWNEDREKWLKLRTLLMDGSRGSAVLITTRNMDIAQMMQTIKPHELQGLDPNKSWSLFRKVAFERGQEPHNSNIVRIGKEIVEMCKGVPIAIRTIGSILYGNNLERDWESFKNDKLAKLSQHENDLLPTLRLSYDCLASHLKHCFAYCRLFPKNHVIDVQKLIKLWMAQGFVKSPNQNKCLEDTGYGYFVDLLGRSFFQEVEKDDWGTIKYCKMHELLHDLAISVAGEHSIIIDKYPENENFHEKIRHISFNIISKWKSSKIPVSFFEEKKLVRTFLLIRQELPMAENFSEKSCEAILSNLKRMRALGLEDMYMGVLPNSFDQVKHLRYIDLSSNRMKKLPNSITGLHNLQTLILTNCSYLLSLPGDLKYMINLRHLLIDGCKKLTHMPSGLGELTSLITLDRFVIADNNSKSKDAAGFAELRRLNNLSGQLTIEKLSHNLQGDAAKSEAANLKEKQHLQSLHLLWNDDVQDGDYDASDNAQHDDAEGGDIAQHDEILLGGLQPHPNLKAFRVMGYMGVNFASWLSSLNNLVYLHLSSCENLQYLPSLNQSMSHLKELKLFALAALEYVNLEREYSWAPREPVFPRLEILQIWRCPNLKGWWKRSGPIGLTPTASIIHQNQPFFPCVSSLQIFDCPNLTSMPLFPNVQYLYLYKTSSIPLQQTAILMKAVVSSSFTPPLASTSSDSIFNSSAPTPLSRLQELHLLHTDANEILPEIVNLSSSLQNLSVGYYPHLTSLQKGIGNLSTLGSLEIFRCPNLVTLPQEMANLSSLTSLHIVRCDKLESMPEKMHRLISLIKLHISACPNLKSLPEGISNLSSLGDLSIVACHKLVSLPQGMHGLTSLNRLYIKECSNLKSLSEGISNLSSLTHLTLDGCHKLASLPEGIGNLSSLGHLTLRRCDELKTLPRGLHGLTSLYELDIEQCSNIESLSEGIANLSSLTKLVIKNCHKLASLPQGMHGLTSLSELDVGGCPSLKSLPEGIGNLSSLEYLYLSGTSLPQWLHDVISWQHSHKTCIFSPPYTIYPSANALSYHKQSRKIDTASALSLLVSPQLI